ncbi:glycosyltransferase [Dyadobacter sediminis]|uniref:Glycosyltransferase family 4 protein n=1 Tax=Dyadobacter sediminis TaxID=1493691 RepID=A0A5R9K959_9BACT|nr:glycosyltransferase [Dyadobacter sediminis]TLU90629.1 glycosyltransferase family 4 protein [Dyadobacter sediminis]GGC09389.1 glycosyl transferase [Dyadobacter sediminis]
MKILHVITLAELGGAQSVVINLVAESIRNGHQVMVASSASGELWNTLPEEAKQWKIPSLQRSISIPKEIRVVKELRKIDAAFNPDIVHLHSSKIGILGRLAFSSSKIIYTVHGFDSIRVAFRKFLFLEKILQKRARHIVGVSQYDYNNLRNEGIQNNIGFIYNGIIDYCTFYNKPESENHIRLKNFIQAKPGFKVICIARIAPPKRFDLFCEVAEKLQVQGVNFFWIGNKEKLTAVPGNVFCLGEAEEAHRLLKYADLFMLPSDYEGMPISILEALCYSVPVIASDVGGISEILNGCNGKAVGNNVSDFAEAILKYVKNTDELVMAKKEARKSYEKYFTIQSMYNAYLDLYYSADAVKNNKSGVSEKLNE